MSSPFRSRPRATSSSSQRFEGKRQKSNRGETLNDLTAQGLKSTETSVLQFSMQTLDAAAVGTPYRY